MNDMSISIHAPREGSDEVISCRLIWLIFQSTLPVRGATRMGYNAIRLLDISIHAPREGSDMKKMKYRDLMRISIHAPREGSDFNRRC